MKKIVALLVTAMFLTVAIPALAGQKEDLALKIVLLEMDLTDLQAEFKAKNDSFNKIPGVKDFQDRLKVLQENFAKIPGVKEAQVEIQAIDQKHQAKSLELQKVKEQLQKIIKSEKANPKPQK